MLVTVNSGSLVETQGCWPISGYLVYTPQKRWRWLGNFGHVALLIRDGDMWIWIDPTLGFIEARTFPVGTKWTEAFDSAVFQKFTVWRKIGRYRGGFPSCVGTVKAFLGIFAPLVIFPKQLYRRML